MKRILSVLLRTTWNSLMRPRRKEQKAGEQKGRGKPSALGLWKTCAGGLLAMTFAACAQFPVPEADLPAGKHVIIDKTSQTLTAYEGDKVILQSRVSTGRGGRRTPSGSFHAGEKQRMHYSRLYDHAPMPWSVQVDGNFFIHGFTSVPDHPASHGCIRMPLTGENPAKRFFDWVETGTPIEITGEWVGKPRR